MAQSPSERELTLPQHEMRGDQPDPKFHSFIVRVWLEETRAEAGRATWRGSIIHVLSGKRRYIADLNEITAFIAPYLQAMGVKFRWPLSITNWLKRRKR